MFEGLAREVKALGLLDPGSLTEAEFGEAAVELARLRSAVEAGVAVHAPGGRRLGGG